MACSRFLLTLSTPTLNLVETGRVFSSSPFLLADYFRSEGRIPLNFLYVLLTGCGLLFVDFALAHNSNWQSLGDY